MTQDWTTAAAGRRACGAAVGRHLIALLAVLYMMGGGIASAQEPLGVAPDPPAMTEPPPAAQDARSPYPWFLSNSYFSVTTGVISYPFSRLQLEPGYDAASVVVPHAAATLMLFGHRFNDHVAADITYMRPIKYVQYVDINHTGVSHSVWMAFGQFMVRGQWPVSRRTAIYGTAGLGITNRTGFALGGAQVVRDAHFTSALVGSGVEYSVSQSVDLVLGLTYAPPNAASSQPHALFVGGGMKYTVRPTAVDRPAGDTQGSVAARARSIEVGYATNAFGYRANDFVSKTVPIFWTGDVAVSRGLAVRYEHNVFHTRRLFALDLGASVSSWQGGTTPQRFFTLSAYPQLRFTIVRTRLADFYGTYTLAGPSYISVTAIDGENIGTNRFTFQDAVGLGAFTGASRRVRVGISLTHYSNGNIFPKNPGVTVPLMLMLGYAF